MVGRPIKAAVALPKRLLDEAITVIAALETAIDARAKDCINRSDAVEQRQVENWNAGELLRLTNALKRWQMRGEPALRKAWEQAKRLGRWSCPAKDELKEGFKGAESLNRVSRTLPP